MNNKELFIISKYVYNETYLQSQLDLAGANTSNMMDRMEKNKKYIRNQMIFNKVILVIYVSFLIFLPVSAYLNVQRAIGNGISITWVLFFGSIVNSVYFLVQVIYLLMVGMMVSTGLFSGDIFAYIATLPLNKKEINKIQIMTLFRTVDAQFIALLLIFPIFTAFFTKSVIITLVSLGISLLNTILAFNLLIIIGSKFSKLVKGSDSNSTKANILRVVFQILYIGIAGFAVLGIQWIMPGIEPLFYQPPSNLEKIAKINQWLSIIPYPISGGYLLTSFLIGIDQISVSLFVPIIIGLIFFALVDILLTRKSLKILNEVLISKNISKFANVKISILEDVSVSVVSPIRAFFNRDKNTIFREIQTTMFIVLPMIFPWMPYLLLLTSTGRSVFQNMDAVIGMGLLYSLAGVMMNILGLTSIESTGTTINQSLPIMPRDQFKARFLWAFAVITIGNLLPLIPLFNDSLFWKYCLLQLTIIFASLDFGVFALLFSIRLFGKLNNKYVLDTVQLKNKVARFVVLFTINAIIGIAILAGFIILLSTQNYSIVVLIMFSSELIIGIVLFLIFNKMFPKSKRKTQEKKIGAIKVES